MVSSVKSRKSRTELLSPGDRVPYIFRLPTELLSEILTLLWDSAVYQRERKSLRNSLSLVCKVIAMIFYRVSQQGVRITSPESYNSYIGHINQLDRSHPMNTHCKSLHFDVNRLQATQRSYVILKLCQPLEMGLQWDGLDYFTNGKDFASKGLLPNLTKLFINIDSCVTDDPYCALFPHFMPKTVEMLHISYSTSLFPFSRRTPIRYPSIPHKLMRLTVTGVRGRIGIARLWESLFEVKELIVDDGQVLPVGKDAPWSLDMKQACDMLALGCKGIGWNWKLGRPMHPSDEHVHWDDIQAQIYIKNLVPRFCFAIARWCKYMERLLAPHYDFPQMDRLPIRRLKSFSHLQGSSTAGTSPTIIPIRRTKSCMELTATGYPYGLYIWRRRLGSFIWFRWRAGV